ncbi:MAG TPA: D-aminoacylase, partial [Sorangium sp.]|nr:D-aminoacylase [Sorangium sp.]
MAYDLKIVNGTIIDGTGRPRFLGDVGIRDGRIVEVGQCGERAERTIDAEAAVVTPGFTDVHTHYDGQVSWDAEFAPSCFHGVTTCIMGNCGVGFAPVREHDQERLVRLMEGVEDIPGTALSEGLTWNWETHEQYMDAIDAFPHTIDFCSQVTHDALRVYVMGERAVADESASEDEVAMMRALTRSALEAGAVGFSTGRSDNHCSADGDPTPASEANVRELMGIAQALKGLQHGVLQAVSDFDMNIDLARFDKEFDVIESMASAGADHPTSISLMQRDHSPNQWRQIIARAEAAQKKGIVIRLQVAARAIGVMLGLEATFHPFMGFPSYKKISHLPLAERVKRMRDATFRDQLLTET